MGRYSVSNVAETNSEYFWGSSPFRGTRGSDASFVACMVLTKFHIPLSEELVSIGGKRALRRWVWTVKANAVIVDRVHRGLGH